MQSVGHITSSVKLLNISDSLADVSTHSPKTLTRMIEIRKYNFLCFKWRCHVLWIFTLLNDKFKPPEAIASLAKSPADGRPGWIANEVEISRKEEIVDFF
jgi:hypothetical protein